MESKIGHKYIYQLNKNRLMAIENRLVVAKVGVGQGRIGDLEMEEANICRMDKQEGPTV